MARSSSSGLRKDAKLTSMPEKLAQWQKRKHSTGVDWGQVNGLELRAALHCALNEGVALMFAPAAGGRGVMIKLYDEGHVVPEFAVAAEELNELLSGIIEVYQGPAEDVRLALTAFEGAEKSG